MNTLTTNLQYNYRAPKITEPYMQYIVNKHKQQS